jgi:hypothetical protein
MPTVGPAFAISMHGMIRIEGAIPDLVDASPELFLSLLYVPHCLDDI